MKKIRSVARGLLFPLPSTDGFIEKSISCRHHSFPSGIRALSFIRRRPPGRQPRRKIHPYRTPDLIAPNLRPIGTGKSIDFRLCAGMNSTVVTAQAVIPHSRAMDCKIADLANGESIGGGR